MKILHLLSSTGYHGAENMAAELIHQLDNLGIDNYVGVFFRNKNSNIDILKVVKPYVRGTIIIKCNGKFDLSSIFVLRNYLKENKIDIIHSHKYKTNFYSLFASLFLNQKLISTCHNWLGNGINMRLYASLDRILLKRFDKIVPVSEEVKNILIKNISHKKILKIPNGIDKLKYNPTLNKSKAKSLLGLPDRKTIGFVGRISINKGISYLLQAADILIKEGYDITIYIVGDGEYRKTLEGQAAELGITDQVIFAGNRSDTPMIYAALDIFVLPSLIEAFPMVILEAMASGIPVIATKVGDIPSMLDEKTGIIVTPINVDALYAAIKQLLDNESYADSLSSTATKRFTTNFTSEIMAKRYLAVYKQALSE